MPASSVTTAPLIAGLPLLMERINVTTTITIMRLIAPTMIILLVSESIDGLNFYG